MALAATARGAKRATIVAVSLRKCLGNLGDFIRAVLLLNSDGALRRTPIPAAPQGPVEFDHGSG